jgi:bifunctional NMN adenylyltransferase/nudix hydrolase
MKVALYIGRFRPFHNAHKITIETALKENDKIIVLVGSCGNPRNIKNPFVFSEIETMILSSFSYEDVKRIIVKPLVDHAYDDTKWIAQVQRNVADNTSAEDTITIYGNEKDHSSFYLKFFPQWGETRSVEIINDLHSTDIRKFLFEDDDNVDGRWLMIKSKVPNNVFQFLKAFAETSAFNELKEEYKFIKEYKQAWSSAPYAPTFVTVDAVVECNGHILLIKRKAIPGRGLWAIAGGFINEYEKIDDAVIRELREETKIDVSKNMLKGSIVAKNVFDNPYRSLRGRTITHAYHFVLNTDYLPDVHGADDASEAKWFPLGTVAEMSESMFEDHADIVSFFTKIDKVFNK